jgi:hypothetical protein
MCAQINKQNTSVASINIEDSVPIIQEFIIPGRIGGPIIQKLNVNTPRKFTLSIEGIPPTGECNTTDLDELRARACAETSATSPTGIPNISFDNMFLIEENYSKSSDGSYTLNRTYIDPSS